MLSGKFSPRASKELEFQILSPVLLVSAASLSRGQVTSQRAEDSEKSQNSLPFSTVSRLRWRSHGTPGRRSVIDSLLFLEPVSHHRGTVASETRLKILHRQDILAVIQLTPTFRAYGAYTGKPEDLEPGTEVPRTAKL